MFQQIAENFGTIAVSLVLIALVLAIVAQLRKDKKMGKTSCGAQCGSCPMAGTCHKQN